MPRRSSMQHAYGRIPKINRPRSSFNLSKGYSTAMDADYLVPIYLEETLPGDTANVSLTAFGRLATPIHPIMDNMRLDFHFYHVPNRLVWENWHKFLGAQDDPGDSTEYTIPAIASADTNVTNYPLVRYMGLPGQKKLKLNQISAIPNRAYRLIWNEHYRRQDLQDSIIVDMDDGPDNMSRVELLKRTKRPDYFVQALPWPQRGEAVAIPLGNNAPIYTTTTDGQTITIGEGGITSFTHLDASTSALTNQAGSPTAINMFADLSGATSVTLADLRMASVTQQLLEIDARGGTRINETIKAHFGVDVPDFRVQRPEYLGGGSVHVNISQVQNNSGSTGNLGDLAAYGIASGRVGFVKTFVEHGYVMCLANLVGDQTYTQGIDRHWSRRTRYDFYYPIFAGIGEQPIYNKEIYADHDSGGSNGGEDIAVWGYKPPWEEYRVGMSKKTMLMEPTDPATLAPWHLSEEFTSRPALGPTFIEANLGGPLDRAIAVPTQPHLLLDVHVDQVWARPMPLYGTPGITRL